MALTGTTMSMLLLWGSLFAAAMPKVHNGIEYLSLAAVTSQLNGRCWRVNGSGSSARFIAIVPASADSSRRPNSSSQEYTFIPDSNLVIHNYRKLKLPLPVLVDSGELYLPAAVTAALFPELDVPVLSTLETDRRGDTLILRLLLNPLQIRNQPLVFVSQKNSSLEYRLILGCRMDSIFIQQLRLLSITSSTLINGIKPESGTVGTSLVFTFRQPVSEKIIPLTNGLELQLTPVPKRRVNRVLLDPGHGGKDPGAVGRLGTQEKEIVLDIARRVREELKKLGFEVYLTRDCDEYVSLAERAEKAAKTGSQLFISIHANWAENRAAAGLETYFLSEAKTDWERAVAARENEVFEREIANPFIRKNDPVSLILADLAQHEFLYESSILALRIQEAGLDLVRAQDRGVRQANFYVLRNIFMPAVLVECGFLSNRQEEQALRKPAYRAKLARAIATGISSFAKEYELRLNGNITDGNR